MCFLGRSHQISKLTKGHLAYQKPISDRFTKKHAKCIQLKGTWKMLEKDKLFAWKDMFFFGKGKLFYPMLGDSHQRDHCRKLRATNSQSMGVLVAFFFESSSQDGWGSSQFDLFFSVFFPGIQDAFFSNAG